MNIKKVNQTVTGGVQVVKGSATKVTGDEKSAGSGSTDRLQLSKNYQDIAQARKMLTSGNDVRTEKVVEIRGQLDSGDYHVDAEAVAEKMLEEVI